jgi:hypothetical protein
MGYIVFSEYFIQAALKPINYSTIWLKYDSAEI